MDKNFSSRVVTSREEQDIEPGDTLWTGSDYDHPTMIVVDWDIEYDFQKRCWQWKHWTWTKNSLPAMRTKYLWKHQQVELFRNLISQFSCHNPVFTICFSDNSDHNLRALVSRWSTIWLAYLRSHLQFSCPGLIRLNHQTLRKLSELDTLNRNDTSEVQALFHSKDREIWTCIHRWSELRDQVSSQSNFQIRNKTQFESLWSQHICHTCV
jgi:hypothetical protein